MAIPISRSHHIFKILSKCRLSHNKQRHGKPYFLVVLWYEILNLSHMNVGEINPLWKWVSLVSQKHTICQKRTTVAINTTQKTEILGLLGLQPISCGLLFFLGGDTHVKKMPPKMSSEWKQENEIYVNFTDTPIAGHPAYDASYRVFSLTHSIIFPQREDEEKHSDGKLKENKSGIFAASFNICNATIGNGLVGRLWNCDGSQQSPVAQSIRHIRITCRNGPSFSQGKSIQTQREYLFLSPSSPLYVSDG
jgi:hypothetical protein